MTHTNINIKNKSNKTSVRKQPAHAERRKSLQLQRYNAHVFQAGVATTCNDAYTPSDTTQSYEMTLRPATTDKIGAITNINR